MSNNRREKETNISNGLTVTFISPRRTWTCEFANRGFEIREKSKGGVSNFCVPSALANFKCNILRCLMNLTHHSTGSDWLLWTFFGETVLKVRMPSHKRLFFNLKCYWTLSWDGPDCRSDPIRSDMPFWRFYNICVTVFHESMFQMLFYCYLLLDWEVMFFWVVWVSEIASGCLYVGVIWNNHCKQ